MTDFITNPLHPNWRSRWVIAFGLLFCVLIIIAQRLHTFDQPLEWDLSTYTLVAQQLLNGKQLYADVWDIKPPGIFAAHMLFQSVLGDGLRMIFVSSTLVAIATLLAIFAIVARTNRWAGLVASMCFAIVSADIALEANRANTEAYINLFLASGFAVLVWTKSLRGLVIACGLFALGTLFKQVAIVPALALCLAPSPPAGEGGGEGEDSLKPAAELKRTYSPLTPTLSLKGRGGRMVVLISTTACVWLSVFAYFALTHRAHLAWQTFIIAPRAYGGTIQQQAAALFAIFTSKALVSFLPLLVTCVLTLLISSKHRGTLAMLLSACAFAIALPGHLWAHYLQLLLIPFSLGTGWAVHAIARNASNRVAILTASIVVTGLTILQYPSYQLPSSQWAERQYGGGYIILQDSIAPIQSLLKDNETFFVWADEPWMYHGTHRQLPTAMVFRSHLVDSPLKDYLTSRVIEDLQKLPPDLLLVREGLDGPKDHPVWCYLMEHYRPMPYDGKNYPLLLRYVRIGSDLDRRRDVSRS